MTGIATLNEQDGRHKFQTKDQTEQKKRKKMIEMVWITTVVIAYCLGRWQVVNERKKARAQWKADSWDETPIGTQLAKEMGIEV